jgi:hypothetical protein
MTSNFVFNGVTYTKLIQVDGWIPVSDSWTYASAITINVPSDATTIYKKGWGIRWKQGGAYKYGVIGALTATLLTLISTSDYTVANSAITDVAVAPNPSSALGFPAQFVFAKTYTGFSTDPVQTVTWSTIGNRIFYGIATASNGTSNATGYTMSLAIAVLTAVIGYANVRDNGTEKAGTGYATGTTLTYYNGVFGVAFTNSGSKGGAMQLNYLF